MATAASSRPLHSLSVIYEASKVSSLIIVIPGLGVVPPQDWGKSPGEKPWLETLLLNTAPNARILCFNHGLSAGDPFFWKHLVESGDDLLDDLLKLREDGSIQEFPCLFVCHSIGGIISKQALCSAHQDLSRFRYLLSVVSGLVLLGTPHSKGENDEVWRNVSLIPKARVKKYSKQALIHGPPSYGAIACTRRKQVSRESKCPIGVSTQFEAIQPTFPLLSAYEIRATKMRGGVISKSTLLVKKEVSLTHLRHEQDLMVDADHYDLCDFGGKSKAYQTISGFISTALQATQRDIFLYPASSHSSGLSDTDDAEDSEPKSPLSRPLSRPQNMSPQHVSSSSITRQKSYATQASDKAPPGHRQMSASRLATFSKIPQASNFFRKDPTLPGLVPQLRNTHFRNPSFYGQQEVLKKLEDALLPLNPKTLSKGVQTFGLCGSGGMGKTEIAVQYMFTHKDDYDAIFWVQADQPAKVAEGFCQISLELGLEEQGTKQNQAVSRDLVKEWLTRPLKHYRRPSMPTSDSALVGDFASWLLILDNVDDESILKDYWPTGGVGSILITSRDPLAKGKTFRMTAGHRLLPFHEIDAARFLVELTEGESSSDDSDDGNKATVADAVPADAIAIARRLGGLPLALTQMAGVINSKRLSFEEFLFTYNREQGLKDLNALHLGADDTGYKHTLASVWALEKLSPGAAALLEVISLLDPDRIQEDILTIGAAEVAGRGYPSELSDYQDARAELIKSSLIMRKNGQHFIKVHRLIQDCVRTAMKPERLHHTFEMTVTLITAVWPFVSIEWRHSTSRWAKCEESIPHMLRLKNFYSDFVLKDKVFEANLQFAKLLNEVGWYSYEKSAPENCEPFFQLAQLVYEEQDIEDIDLLSDIYYSRGADASEVNEPNRCMEYTSRFNQLRIDHSTVSPQGRKDIKLGMSYNQMSVAHMMMKDYESAVAVLEEAFEVYNSLDDVDRKIKATLPSANMGLAYWFLGRYDEAYNVLIAILREREELFGKDDNESFKTGRVLHALGNVQGSQGKLKESFDFHQRALLQYRSTIGDNHHRTADVCYKVAEHYMRFGKLENAKKLLEQALKVFSSRVYYRHEKARADRLMGRLMAIMGNEAKSAQYLKEALDGFRSVNPGDRRSRDELLDRDFEELVCFWSR